jgi:hypothetical protein
MFMMIVFICLMTVLILSGGAVIHMGVFKAHRPETGFCQKVLGGIMSYAISALAWLALYSYHYLGW